MTEREQQTMRDERNAMRNRQQLNQKHRRTPLIDAWYDLMNADEQCPLNVRVDLTLKQKRNSDLAVVVRDPDAPAHALRTIVRRPTHVPSDSLTVRPKTRTVRIEDAERYAASYYLTEDEARRLAIRVVNRLNKAIFGRAATRRPNPSRLTVLICQHDRQTRRHIHALFAVPPSISLVEFELLLSNAMKTEPFIARIHNVELIEDITRSLTYNIRDDKTLSDNSILYICPSAAQRDLTTSKERDQ